MAAPNLTQRIGEFRLICRNRIDGMPRLFAGQIRPVFEALDACLLAMLAELEQLKRERADDDR